MSSSGVYTPGRGSGPATASSPFRPSPSLTGHGTSSAGPSTPLGPNVLRKAPIRGRSSLGSSSFSLGQTSSPMAVQAPPTSSSVFNTPRNVNNAVTPRGGNSISTSAQRPPAFNTAPRPLGSLGSGVVSSANTANSHESFVKAVLQQRLARLYWQSFAVTHFVWVYILSLTVHGHPFAFLTSPRSYLTGFDSYGYSGPGILSATLLSSFSVWAFGVLPLLILARWTISGRLPPAHEVKATTLAHGSPLDYILRSVQSKGIWVSAAIHFICASVFAKVFWLSTLSYPHDSDRWNLLLDVPKRPGQYRPNEHVIYLFASTAFFGLFFALAKSLAVPLRKGASPPSRPVWILSTPAFDPYSTESTIKSRLATAVYGPSGTLWTALSLSTATSTAILGTYVFSRKFIYRTILSIIGVRSPLRAVLIPSFRHTFLTPNLVLSTFVLHLVTATLWALAEALWQVYATQPHVYSSAARDPTRCLTQGIVSKPKPTASSAYFRNFAFAELSLLTQSDSDRRKGIFKDLTGVSNRQIAPRPLLSSDTTASGAGPLGGMDLTSSPVAQVRRAQNLAGASTGTAWNIILGQCLEILEKHKAWAKKRGKDGPGAPAPAPAVKKTSQQSAEPGKPAPMRSILKETSTNIVQPPKLNVWEKLAAGATAKGGAPPAPAAPAAASSAVSNAAASASGAAANVWHRLAPSTPESGDTAQATADKAAEHAKKVVQAAKAVPPPTQITVADIAKVVVATAQGVWQLIPTTQRNQLAQLPIWKYLPVTSEDLLHPSPLLIVRNEVLQDNKALLVWSATALSKLATASLHEDEYGVVQKDLPAILICFAELLRELEAWGKELAAVARARDQVSAKSGSTPTSEQEDAFHQEWESVVGPVIATLQGGITDILVTFQEYSLDLRPDELELVRSSVSSQVAETALPPAHPEMKEVAP